MRSEEITRMTESTSDAAFAVDGEGLVVAWNHAAEALFALPTSEAMGRACGDIVQGADECGAVCSQECTVRQSVAKRHPIGNFDLLINTASGRQWCNVSVLVAENGATTNPHAIHIVRPIDLRKRLEILVRDFVVSKTSVPAEEAVAMISSTRDAAKETELTERELEILRLLGKGSTTSGVADQLNISRTTVNNHVQHILRKLNAHTRLEAIRRAEHAGLI
ncbi:MAG TPA: LuxR C-terminal-related transcriptional regulator [Pyrinomonadaceae bacterium]